jgi:allophanate hydrolase
MILPDWAALHLGVPKRAEFFDAQYAALFERAIERARLLGATIVEVDLTPFLEVGKLLYNGPWIAERYAAVGAFIDSHPGAVNEIVAALISPSKAISASAAFEGQYRLETLRKQTAAIWAEVDALLLPTAPHIPTLAALGADPLLPNFRNGIYTTFVNLLDLAAVALPAGFRDDGAPFGIQLIAGAHTDGALLDLAERWSGIVELAVVGAHLAGQPLHYELGGAPLVARTRTAPSYRLFALDTVPPKPGLVRAGTESGDAMEVEVYALTAEQFGRFVAAVPAPLAIGTVELAAGRTVKGFVCEPAALERAEEITAFGGWRAYRASLTG